MARTETLANLRAQVRERCEVRSQYVSDSALNAMINQSIADLDNLILDVCPDYKLSSNTISVVANDDTYALPSDFYKARGVDYVRSATSRVALRKFNWAERNRYADDGYVFDPGRPENSGYRIVGSNLILFPVPSWSGSVILWYIAAPTKLVSDSDTYDGVAGFEEWVILDCCVKCMAKEESDPAVFLAQKRIIEARIADLANDRDIGEPDRMRDASLERIGVWPLEP